MHDLGLWMETTTVAASPRATYGLIQWNKDCRLHRPWHQAKAWKDVSHSYNANITIELMIFTPRVVTGFFLFYFVFALIFSFSHLFITSLSTPPYCIDSNISFYFLLPKKWPIFPSDLFIDGWLLLTIDFDLHRKKINLKRGWSDRLVRMTTN